MNYIGCKEDINSLSNTLLFKRLLNNFTLLKSEDKPYEKEYSDLINCLLSFDELYFLASSEQIEKTEKEIKSVPRISKHPQFGLSLNVFTIAKYCNDFSAKAANETYYIAIKKDSGPTGIYNSVFQHALKLGVENIIVNEGHSFIVIPIKDIFTISGMTTEANQVLTDEESKLVEEGKLAQVPIHFNKNTCSKKVHNKVWYRFETTWPVDFETILCDINVMLPYFKDFHIGTRQNKEDAIKLITDNKKLKDNTINNVLKEPVSSVVISGFNSIINCVTQIEFINDSKMVDMFVYDENPDEYKRYDFKFYDRAYETFMDSVEIMAQKDLSFKQALKFYKNYLNSELNQEQLTKESKELLEEKVFERYGFNPSLNIPSNAQNKKRQKGSEKRKEAVKKETAKTLEDLAEGNIEVNEQPVAKSEPVQAPVPAVVAETPVTPSVPEPEPKKFAKISEIYSKIQDAFPKEDDIMHKVSYPLIIKKNGKYLLSSFAFYFSIQDIRSCFMSRPTRWATADVIDGSDIVEYITAKDDFSKAPYNVKYDMRQTSRHDTSEAYYNKAYAILDDVRMELFEKNTFNEEKYKEYFDMILENIPDGYKRFYEDLSNVD